MYPPEWLGHQVLSWRSIMSEIMLAKGFDSSKLLFPVEVSIKLDGVACDFYKTAHGWAAQSRQGKPLPSVAYILDHLDYAVGDALIGTHIVGELTVMGVSCFKEAAGIIRRQEADERIVLNVYDAYHNDEMDRWYAERVQDMNDLIEYCSKYNVAKQGNVSWQIIKRVPVSGRASNIQELQKYLEGTLKMMKQSPSFEGLVIRDLHGKNSVYKVGKRSWGMMKYKPKPSLDLKVVSFEEATANKDMSFLGEAYEKGEGLCAVGRINVEYKGEVIGVGPGCLTHVERRTLWNRFLNGDLPDVLIAEVEYMLDDSYDALRQPVFKRWRPDKDTPNEKH